MPARALVALALVVAAAGCDGGADANRPPSPEPPSTPVATGEPSPAVPALPESPAPDAGAWLVGTARVDDPSGDVADEAGNPPGDPEPAADLRAVALEGDGEVLTVTFELDGPVPPAAASLVWSVKLASDDEPEYEVTAQLAGGRLVAAVFDWRKGVQEPLPDPVVEGDRLSLRVPSRLLDRLPDTFQWQALTQLDGGYEDRAPDGMAERARFPQG